MSPRLDRSSKCCPYTVATIWPGVHGSARPGVSAGEDLRVVLGQLFAGLDQPSYPIATSSPLRIGDVRSSERSVYFPRATVSPAMTPRLSRCNEANSSSER